MTDDKKHSPAEEDRALRSDHTAGSRDDEEGTPGGQKVEKVENRENVGQVQPEDYPSDQRAKGDTGVD